MIPCEINGKEVELSPEDIIRKLNDNIKYYYDYIDIYGKHIDLEAETFEEADKEAQSHFETECLYDGTCLLEDRITILKYRYSPIDDYSKEVVEEIETVVEYLGD